MNIYDYLKKDHQKVAELMERVVKNDDPEERATLFEMIKHELALHAETEEATFYKAIDEAARENKTEKDIQHAHGEHDEIRECLQKISGTAAEDENWMAYFQTLKQVVTHHVEEEESEIFDDAKQLFTDKQARELATRMDDLKQQTLSKKSAA